MIQEIYKGKKVLVTGHTGFKGTWLARTLVQLGADVYGIGLEEGDNKIFSLTNTKNIISSHIADIRDRSAMEKLISTINPEIVFHLAAQPLVLESYNTPVETFDTNVMGTIHILESCRSLTNLQTMVMITTDKVYYNNEWVYPYRETDRLGGDDPYSASKALCELAIDSYRRSFYKDSQVSITSVRAGNVIGGGDFANNRIVPDIVCAIQNNIPVSLRSPNSVRPWQHVLDVISAYLLIGAYNIQHGLTPSLAYNVAPLDNSREHTVEYIVKQFIHTIQQGSYIIDNNANYAHEMSCLQLDPSLIISELGWYPYFTTDEAINQTALEYKQWLENPTQLAEQIDTSITNYNIFSKK